MAESNLRKAKTFKGDLQKFADKVGIDAVTLEKRVAFDVFGGVTLATPVKTGRARAGWTINVNAPVMVEAPFDGRQVTESDVTMSSAQALGSLTELTQIYIDNSVPYINGLNNGYSKRSPKGFVQRAIRNALSFLKKKGR